MQVGSLLRYSEGTSVKENLVNLAGYSSRIGGSALARGASRVFLHLHTQTTKEEHHEAQTIEFCTPLLFCVNWWMSADNFCKTFIHGSIPIAASNPHHN